jgi:ABC-2 type transport system ATP-binding protein
MIHQGELLIVDTPSAVKAQMKGTILELRTEDNQRSMRFLERVEMLRGSVLSGDKIHVIVDDPQAGEQVIREVLKAKGMRILDLLVVRPSLEDAFVSMVRSKSPHPPFPLRARGPLGPAAKGW